MTDSPERVDDDDVGHSRNRLDHEDGTSQWLRIGLADRRQFRGLRTGHALLGNLAGGSGATRPLGGGQKSLP